MPVVFIQYFSFDVREVISIMPRSLSTALQAQVSSTATKTAFLVELELNLSTTIGLTDWYSAVTYDSNNYEPGGSFLTVDSTNRNRATYR